MLENVGHIQISDFAGMTELWRLLSWLQATRSKKTLTRKHTNKEPASVRMFLAAFGGATLDLKTTNRKDIPAQAGI
ncbi:MAG: hypothetical protein CL666_01120 [Balneola sp.]|nr:hypothetical protein [Balneola sp.]|tara:strand:+ start:44203 stop:44430 length:228 start_codon:yes stop_codon:yes gene_type:complete